MSGRRVPSLKDHEGRQIHTYNLHTRTFIPFFQADFSYSTESGKPYLTIASAVRQWNFAGWAFLVKFVVQIAKPYETIEDINTVDAAVVSAVPVRLGAEGSRHCGAHSRAASDSTYCPCRGFPAAGQVYGLLVQLA